MKKSNKKGFTIVELVVVIAIIAVLAAVLIPTFASLINKANESAYQQERTNQMIQDEIEKIEKGEGNYMSWKDVEEAIAKALKESTLTADKIIEIVGVGKDTGLTNEQLTAILEAIANKKFSDTQVKVILDPSKITVDGMSEEQIKEAINEVIAKLPQVGITKEDIAAVVSEVASGNTDLANQINKAIEDAIKNIPTLDKDGIAEIVAEILATPACNIGNVSFETFADALNSLDKNGETTIVLNKNVPIFFEGYFYTIDKNQTLTIDLNGHIIEAICSKDGTSAFLYNKGTLKLVDSKDSGKTGSSGRMSVVASPSWTWSGIENDYAGSYASNLIRNEGKLTIENGHYSNTTDGSASYVVDNYSAGEITINGGRLDASRASAIRMFYNNGGKLTINDGIIGSESSFMGVQVMGTNATNGVSVELKGGTYYGDYSVYAGGGEASWAASSLVISGGTYNAYVCFTGAFTNVSVTGGTFNSECFSYGDVKFISDGTFSSDVSSYCVDGYFSKEVNGKYEVKPISQATDEDFVAYVGSQGYVAFNSAKEAANGNTIRLNKDLSGFLMFSDGGTYTLDLNGHNITDPTGSGNSDAVNVFNSTILVITDNSTGVKGAISSVDGCAIWTGSSSTDASAITINGGVKLVGKTNCIKSEEGTTTIIINEAETVGEFDINTGSTLTDNR